MSAELLDGRTAGYARGSRPELRTVPVGDPGRRDRAELGIVSLQRELPADAPQAERGPEHTEVS